MGSARFAEVEIPEDLLAEWQSVVDLMAELTQVPAGLIMRLAGEDIEVFLSSRTESNPYKPGDREHFADSGLYCETVINSGRRLLIPDALADPDWKDNPDVELGMISYLGYPIYYPDKTPFGTICVLDKEHNPYSPTVQGLVEKLRNLVERQLHLHCMNAALGDENKQLVDYLDELKALRGIVTVCAKCKKIKEEDGSWSPVEKFLIRHPGADFSHTYCPTCHGQFIEEIDALERKGRGAP